MNKRDRIESKWNDEAYPRADVLQSKSLMITERQAYELETVSAMVRAGGKVSITQSDLVRMCLDEALEQVKERVCSAMGIDAPSFYSK